MADLVDMSSQFKGLPMADLIGGPLAAACDAQIALANATANFIEQIGFYPPATAGDPAVTRTAIFTFDRPVEHDDGSSNIEAHQEKVHLEVPMLAIVSVVRCEYFIGEKTNSSPATVKTIAVVMSNSLIMFSSFTSLWN